MGYRIVTDCNSIDFFEAAELLKAAGLTARPAELVEKAFVNSYKCVFVFNGDVLIGIGRAISDGAYEAGIYDVAVLPEHQGKGLGKSIIEELSKSLQGINVFLYARPGVEKFYSKLGFSKLLTGMIKFVNKDTMRSRGFIE